MAVRTRSVYSGLKFLQWRNQARAVTQYGYDSLGRIVSFTDPSGKKENYRYDANGNLITVVDRNEKSVRFAFDGLDRMIKRESDYNGSLETVEYSYDLLGNRTRMVDTRGVTTYDYDSLGRMSSIRQDNGISLNYTYNVLNQRVSMTLQ